MYMSCPNTFKVDTRAFVIGQGFQVSAMETFRLSRTQAHEFFEVYQVCSLQAEALVMSEPAFDIRTAKIFEITTSRLRQVSRSKLRYQKGGTWDSTKSRWRIGVRWSEFTSQADQAQLPTQVF